MLQRHRDQSEVPTHQVDGQVVHARETDCGHEVARCGRVLGVASPGGGVAFLTIDGDLLAASTISNLIGDVAAAHGRCCAAAPANAGVATQTPSFPGFPTGGASGSYNQGFDLNAPAAYNAAFVAPHGGQAYFNVHTTFARGGEIRGQVALIPEPASWALMIAGFGIAGAAIRWRRSVFKT